MEKIVVVNDTNVFIDLYNIGLLEEFFSLPWDVRTTDFVMYELTREGQNEMVYKYKEAGKLYIPVFEPEELAKIVAMFHEHNSQSNVSLTDCSVWYYAKTNNYVLLTGDRKLRSSSLLDGVEVHGILHVLDILVEYGIISYFTAIKKIEQLYNTNPRLPQEEKEQRIRLWKFEIDKKGGSL